MHEPNVCLACRFEPEVIQQKKLHSKVSCPPLDEGVEQGKDFIFSSDRFVALPVILKVSRKSEP